jgi:hypothetical protein
MRRLKLQMQTTVDGFVAGPQGQLDWMTFDMDDALLAFINHLTDTSDTILFVNPVAIGEGLRVFQKRSPLALTASKAYPSGIVVNTYGKR